MKENLEDSSKITMTIDNISLDFSAPNKKEIIIIPKNKFQSVIFKLYLYFILKMIQATNF